MTFFAGTGVGSVTIGVALNRDDNLAKESLMETATIAIDLAKSVFELAAADKNGRVIERRRLSRGQLERYFENRIVGKVVMEACGTAHHWGRWFAARGIKAILLPPHYVRAYVRPDKTDRADATALLEASRASDIVPVSVKSLEQQALQSLHRVRAAWNAERVARINLLRSLCREFGINAPVGAEKGIAELRRVIADDSTPVPDMLRGTLLQLLEELREIDGRQLQLETHLAQIARQSPVCQRLRTIPGIGVLTSTAFFGAVADIRTFPNARRFAGWLGLTPREHSSGTTRRLGAISKRGDGYLRMLLVYGARAVLYSGNAARRAGRRLDALRAWGLRVLARSGHNKAAVAIANKLARIIWATWHRQQDFHFHEELAVTA